MIWRAALRNEVPAIAGLIAEDHRGAPPDLSMNALLAAFDAMERDPAVDLIVGLQDSVLVATYQLTLMHGLSLTDSCRAMLESVRVRRSQRGQGIGGLLIADALERARARGATLVQLMSNSARADARRFYERQGFAASHTGFKHGLD